MNSRYDTVARGTTIMTNTIFWDVDTQIDFIDPLGKLYVPRVETIKSNIADLTKIGAESGRLLGSVDAHTPRDNEFKEWPEHCVYGTPGQRKIPESTIAKILYIPSTKLTRKQLSEAAEFSGQVIFEKHRNDVRTNPNVKPLFKLTDPDLTVIYGVVTEICVDQAVNYIAGDLGYKSIVAVDSIKEIDSTRANQCIANWEKLGVELIKTSDILKMHKAHAFIRTTK